MVEHIYLDMTNKASWVEFKQLQHKVAQLEAEIENLKKPVNYDICYLIK